MKDIKMMAAVVAATIGAFGAYAGGGTAVSLTPLNLAPQGETGAAAPKTFRSAAVSAASPWRGPVACALI